MSNNQRKKRKKNQQVHRLIKNVRKDTGLVENTTAQDVISLSGSDESKTNFDEHNKGEKKEKISGKPFKYIITDFVKENWKESVVIGILIPIAMSVAGWNIHKTIEMDKNLAEYEIRINRLEKDVEGLAGKIPNKELVEYEINDLKTMSKDMDEFNRRLTRLEHIVSAVK